MCGLLPSMPLLAKESLLTPTLEDACWACDAELAEDHEEKLKAVHGGSREVMFPEACKLQNSGIT